MLVKLGRISRETKGTSVDSGSLNGQICILSDEPDDFVQCRNAAGQSCFNRSAGFSLTCVED